MANLKKLTACVYDYGQYLELAITLSKQFGRVLYFAPWLDGGNPTSQSLRVGEGFNGVERITEIWPHLDDIDLVIFPDVYQAELQEYLISRGKRVWGCRMGSELELDRVKSKKLCKKLGIDIGPYDVVTGIDALREHLQDHDDRWVKVSRFRGNFETFHAPDYERIEPRLDELEHKLGAEKKLTEFIVEDAINGATEVGYDGYSIDGAFPKAALIGVEAKDLAYVGRTMPYSRLPEAVKGVNQKLAPALKKYGYRGFISTEIRCTTDNMAYLIDPCFSDDTEILTDKGWKRFQDLDRSENVATLNVETRKIEYQTPTDYIAHHYSGELIEISNKERGIECLVTPNHGIWRTDRYGKDLFRERADSLTDKGYIPRTGSWGGVEELTYTLPWYHRVWSSGRKLATVREEVFDAVDIPMDDWLAFLALFLAEGSLRSEWAVNITQTAKIEDVASVLKKLPFNVTYLQGGFVVHSVQLAEHLRGSGLCNTKRVPDYVKELSPRLINIFLDAYLLGDGTIHRTRGQQRSYSTTSKLMADDLQELIFRAGRLANIRVVRNAGTTMSVGDKTYTRRYDQYVVVEVAEQNRFWFEAAPSRRERYIQRTAYDGMVYDVTVANHTVYVRRNGKPFWSSNCTRAGSPPSELQQVMIENLGEILWEGADGTMVEPKYRAKCGAMVFLLSDWASENWQHVWFPSAIRDRVKLHNATKIDGEYYVIPRNDRRSHIGAVVGLGDSEQAAIEDCKRIAKKVEGYQIEKPCEALDDAAEKLTELLGPQKPPSPLERKASEMMRSGKISQKQYERLMSDH